MLAGVLGVALAAPTVFTRTCAVRESWFYPPLGVARAGLTTDALASSSSIAKAFVVRARELVPARWVALMLLDPTTAREGPGWACIASDGELPPTWPASDRLVVLANLAKEIVGVAVLPFDGSPTLSMAVCVGQRLDGTPPGGIDIETIQLLAMRVLPSVEAGVLRERTLAQARFREGLWELARELAAVGPETDVLRVTARHGAALLGAELATVLRRQTTDGQAYVPVAGMPELDNPDELSSVVQLDMEARDQSGYVSYLNLPDQYSMLVCWLGAAEPAEALMVLVRHTPFTDEDARRAVEIAEHAAGALRRSHLFAFADETRAQHEVDRLRNELVSTVTYEIRSPLTAVLGYAQMLRQRSESLTSYDIARIARQIELSAAATRDIVHDLSTTPLHGAGREQVRIRSVDLSQAIPRIAQRFRALPGGDRIIVDVEAGLSTRADLSRLDQIVGNLLLNALEHPAPGQVVVRASAASSSEVWIEVGHQGPAEGLAAMRSLAELHGGRVELATNQQGNSTFRVTLPRAS
jgi:K+-sensing histidine kinase KdpD